VEDLEGRHGGNVLGSRNTGLAVDVDFGEGNLLRSRVLFGESFESGRDRLARAAPVGVDYTVLVIMTVAVGSCARTICDNHISACEEAAPFGFGADADRAAHGCDIVIVGFIYLRMKGHICRMLLLAVTLTKRRSGM